nr:MAG TPA_asm: hypothetical protein [Caudoviricetes sp.]
MNCCERSVTHSKPGPGAGFFIALSGLARHHQAPV